MSLQKTLSHNLYRFSAELPFFSIASLLLVLRLNSRLVTPGHFPPVALWAWSELHINYAGGFVRRGLLGEIAFRLQSLFDLPTTTFFGTIFLVLTLLMIGLLFGLLRPLWSRPLVVWVVLLSPAIILFPVFDRGASLRKDIFVSIGLLLHALMVQATRQGRLTLKGYQRLMLICVAPLVTINILIHEQQWFFLPVHMILMILAVGSRRDALRRTAVTLIPALLLGPVMFAYSGDAQTSAAICNSWRGRVEVNCSDSSGIGAIGWSIFDAMAFVKSDVLSSPRALLLWSLATILSWVPAVVLLHVFRREVRGQLKVVKGALVMLLPTVPLFVVSDWGRLLHLQAISEVAVLLSLAPVRLTTEVQKRKLVTVLLVLSAGLYVLAWHLPHAGILSNLFISPDQIFVRAIRLLK